MNILYTVIGMLYDGSVSKLSPHMYKNITKYYTKAREWCIDIIKSTVYLTKDLLLTEQTELCFWHDLRRHYLWFSFQLL